MTIRMKQPYIFLNHIEHRNIDFHIEIYVFPSIVYYMLCGSITGLFYEDSHLIYFEMKTIYSLA
jgi:hypothetical protein